MTIQYGEDKNSQADQGLPVLSGRRRFFPNLFRQGKKPILILAAFFISGGVLAEAYFIDRDIDPARWIRDKISPAAIDASIVRVADEQVGNSEPPPPPGSTVIGELPLSSADSEPVAEAKKQIAKSPPRQEMASSSGIVGETVKSENGTVTTLVSEGNVSQSEYSRVSEIDNHPTDPYGVGFSDETGRHSDLEQILKDYINNSLKWGDEIGSLKEITIRDAGDTGWSGLYNGSYTMTPSGDITSAFGWITLNVSYYTDSPYLNDYMKAVLAHEYGHHYTLYHKWVDADLAAGTRFPDSYYNVRPLLKDTTTVDCSTGWSACEPEIIAEDYAYFYSGYGYHAMESSAGLPSEGTKNWLDDIIDSLKSNVTETAVPQQPVNAPPTISIISPASDSSIGNEFNFSVAASDDKGVAKVIFYRGESVLAEDTSDPYGVSVDLSGLSEGEYTFKAQAIDTDGASAERSFVLTIARTSSPSDSSEGTLPVSTGGSAVSSGDSGADAADTTLPSVVFSKPDDTPHSWTSGSLIIRAEASDNIAVIKIDLYINDSLVATEEGESFLQRRWDYGNVGPGTYTLRVKAYDAAGNIGETVAQIDKS